MLRRCSLKEDTVLSGSAPGSQRGAQNFSNIIERAFLPKRSFPAHTVEVEKKTLNNCFSADWAQICEGKWATNLGFLASLKIITSTDKVYLLFFTVINNKLLPVDT